MPQIAELKEIDGSVWARVPMELGSPIQILSPAEIEDNRERESRHLDEIERMRAALVRIDAINDNPACFSTEINDLCGPILRPHLYQYARF